MTVVHEPAAALALAEAALAAAHAAPGVVWRTDDAAALAHARDVDRRTAAGAGVGPLAGLPVLVKDSFDVAGLPTTLGLAAPTHVATRDAAVVARLRAADAIVIGKTAMDQLAWSMSGQAPGFPPLDNPAAPGHMTGGSSGGSAAAVAGGIVTLALGSDSAGSVRVPAAWCGVVGFKPTHGALPVDGLAPLAPSVDAVGLLAATVAEVDLLFAVLTDALPAESARSAAAPAGPIRVGVPELDAGVFADAATAAAWSRTVDRLAAGGAEIVAIGPELRAPGLGTVLAVELAERWGQRLRPAHRATADVRAGLAFGAGQAAPGYARALDALRGHERRARALFADVDVIASPTTPLAAPRAGGAQASVARASRFTRPLSAFGWPAVSVPAASAGGRPLGLQLSMARGEDRRLLACARRLAGLVGAAALENPTGGGRT